MWRVRWEHDTGSTGKAMYWHDDYWREFVKMATGWCIDVAWFAECEA